MSEEYDIGKYINAELMEGLKTPSSSLPAFSAARLAACIKYDLVPSEQTDILTPQQCIVGFLATAKAIKEHCNSRPTSCEGCRFDTDTLECPLTLLMADLCPGDWDIDALMDIFGVER